MNDATSSVPVDVAVGILMRENGEVLLGKRTPGRPYPGYWEFPGGKVEPDESIEAALEREFFEELGITLLAHKAWCCVEYIYPHAHVRLHFFICPAWQGEPKSREGQEICWQREILVEPLLPATIPLVHWLDRLRGLP